MDWRFHVDRSMEAISKKDSVSRIRRSKRDETDLRYLICNLHFELDQYCGAKDAETDGKRYDYTALTKDHRRELHWNGKREKFVESFLKDHAKYLKKHVRNYRALIHFEARRHAIHDKCGSSFN